MHPERILETYMQPIFYFMLRKTSDRAEAEDLTQTVFLEILTALQKGIVPEDERAWVWKIARNHYARWAARRTNDRRSVNVDDLRETVSDGTSVEDDVLRSEEVTLLYRELAHLREDYRSIVCAYYFENRSLGEIAASRGLPLGTVKRKISECRKHLKEGMTMARTYGKRSFAPEEIKFSQNWNPASGQDGMRYVEHILPQNILLEAYDNPSTAEELSLALGVAMPYMENELNFLMEGELLLLERGKYRTNLIILTREIQERLYALSEDILPAMTEAVKKAVAEVYAKPDCPKNVSFEDLKLTLAERILATQMFFHTPDKLHGSHTIRHQDGSEWALTGYAVFEMSDECRKCLEVTGSETYHQIIMLGNRGNVENIVVPVTDLPVFPVENNALFATPQTERICALYGKYAEGRNAVYAAENPAYLHGKANLSDPTDFRRKVIDRLIDEGWITLAEDMNKSPVGMWMYR